jgi:colanic acid/amylovoran biosynthesis glycosyltransferase
MKTIALISPNKSAYSETFIQAHKNLLNAEVKYYYNGSLPCCLEGVGQLQPTRSYLALRRICTLLHYRADTTFQEDLLIASFKKNKIDKVYAEYGPTAAAVLNVCKKNNLPLIVNFHGYDSSVGYVLSRNREKYHRVFDYAQSIVAVSKHMVNTLIGLGADKDKISYAPYGPQDSFFQVQPRYSENMFVAAGRFVNKKAPYYTLLAFFKVLKKYPDARLYFAGDGPLLNTCRNIVRHHASEDKIVFLGNVAPEELQKLYEGALGFVQHSITADDGDMEGTPVAVLEASASGLPVIATEHAGIPDVVINGQTGLLVKEHDVDGMAENMMRLLDDRKYAISLGQRGREYVKDNFSMNKHIGILNALIDA